MERWHQVHDVRTQQEWQAEQPKPMPNVWDGWHMAMPATSWNNWLDPVDEAFYRALESIRKC